MRANGFTDTDGLCAIEAAKPKLRIAAADRYDQRHQRNRVNAELTRRDQIAVAVRRDERARVPVAAASGLETAR